MVDNCQIAIFSDLHLGIHMNSPVWHEISLDWAKWVTSELKKKDIKEIIFCGDFFHSRSEITVNTLHHASNLLEVFDDFKITMIVGNHDAFYRHNSTVNSISIFKGRKNIEVINEPKVVQKCGRELFFAPWGTPVDKIQSCDIIFGHFEIESFKMNTFKICDHGLKAEALIRLAPLVISGHFHLREERSYKKGTILYVGCPFELDFGDTCSTKGYYILDLPSMKYDFFPNEISPKHSKIMLSELVKIPDFKNKASEYINNNIVKIVVDKNISNDDLDSLTFKLNSYGPLSIVIDHTNAFDKFGALSQEEVDLSGVDIPRAISEFVDMLEIQNKKEVVDYTVSLYHNCK
jgi:DNA repair exonuclease SbcCD nuclease subunit